MDPYSSEGELVNIHTAFHQSQFQAVLDFDTSSFSSSNALPARLLQLRSHCALRQYDAVLSSVSSSEASSNPDLAAVRLLAQYGKTPANASKIVAEAETLAEKSGDNLGVQICVGSVLASAGEHDKALALLKRHQGSLDAVALIVQVYLSMNRADLAAKECRTARGFAQDALLVNLGEAWVGMREGGEKYQQAYYVFEELAQAPSTQAAPSLTAQGVSEIHLGRLPEAEVALQQAVGLAANDPDALANQAVLNTILGKQEEVDAAVGKLQAADPSHPFITEISKRKSAFDAAASKYTPKFEP
ncbi:hypothetical protein K461DRAFT_223195 [Myriangium duriaei CBS 260.36]|uniref:Coatomer subunit epsilon n=1 Tax=Myriangium duriaei CBS 260.36 TaxID=1168546 RepID=A0A9P4ML61_9PEZI|nr:hypothetical protein K461DRAFT_223195 [Myriangium duriaei CBS 260.36]